MSILEEGSCDGDDADARPRSAAIHRIATRIVAGSPCHEVGDVLPIEDVMREFQVSRSLVREVLQALEHKGMVTRKARVGATVQALREWKVLDADVIAWRLSAAPTSPHQEMMEVREAIEPRAAFLAAQRASGEVRRDLVNLAVKLKSLADDEGFQELNEAGETVRNEFLLVDAKLHRKILEGTNNVMFLAHAGIVEEALRFRIKHNWEGACREKRWAGQLGDDVRKPASGEGAKGFPPRPERLAMWFHYGLTHAIEQRRPQAAETFSRAIIAEVQGSRLDDEYVRGALLIAMNELDHTRLPEAYRDPFFDEVLAAVRPG
jgi:DNA-binding FadR family transcriptional regulator